MNKEYFDAIVRRYKKMEKLDPGWDHNDLRRLNWVLRLRGGNGDCSILSDCVSRKDWKALNNYYYQCTRFNIFPTLVHRDFTAWQFWDALTAIAVGDRDSFEYLFPKDEPLTKLVKDSKEVHPLLRAGRMTLAGLWYQNDKILEYAIPVCKIFITRKYPKSDLALIEYMLALQEHDLKKAGECLEAACKIMRSAEWEPEEKNPWICGHGLYMLAAKVFPVDEFKKLAVPDCKTFCKEYAGWRIGNQEPLKLYAPFPEKVDFLNDMFESDYRSYPWIGLDEAPCMIIPSQWRELLDC